MASRNPVEVKPRVSARLPSWKPQTRIPKVADSDRMFMIIALIGSTTDPKARNSSTNIVSARNSPTQGSRSPSPSRRSTCAAEAPPTRTSEPAGVGTARTSSTSVRDAASCGSPA